MIAAAQVLASRERTLHHLVDAESAELSERLLGAVEGDWVGVALRTWLGRRALLGLEKAVLHGLLWHWLGRKRMIEKLLREARAEGFSQLLVVGAGLDTLPWRLAREGAMDHVVCVDHPATQAVVRRAIPEGEGRVRLVPVDLSVQGLSAELERATAMEPLPTVVVVEGLLMYLTPEREIVLLKDIAALHVPRLRVILTAMDSAEGEPVSFRPRSARAERWLARRSEPMRSSIPLGKEAEVLGATGLRHVRTILASELREVHAPALDGENILIAER